MPRTGRPRKYDHPVRLVVWLEARELRCLNAVAKAAGAAPTSAWARQVLLEVAAAHDNARATRRKRGSP
jgi:hypothetical protein